MRGTGVTTGKEIFEALVQYPLPKRDGVRDYVVYLVNQAKPFLYQAPGSVLDSVTSTSTRSSISRGMSSRRRSTPRHCNAWWQEPQPSSHSTPRAGPNRPVRDRLFSALETLRREDFLVFEYAGFEVDQGIELVCEAMQAAAPGVRPFCYFHQQCILHALDGEPFRLYFGEATRDADDVTTRTSKVAGERIVRALAATGLSVIWNGDEQTAIEIGLIWQCRPRRVARASP